VDRGRVVETVSSPVQQAGPVSKVVLEIDARALHWTYRRATVGQVPREFWDWVVSLGVGAVWLKGPWEMSRYYAKLMKGFAHDNNERGIRRISSGFDPECYELNRKVAASDQEMRDLAVYLGERGVILLLDFVTNHIAADSRLIKEVPGLVRHFTEAEYLSVVRRQHPKATAFRSDEELLNWLTNKFAPYYRLSKATGDPADNMIIPHAWGGYGQNPMITLAQLFYAHEEARRYMKENALGKIMDLTQGGGFRADLAPWLCGNIFTMPGWHPWVFRMNRPAR